MLKDRESGSGGSFSSRGGSCAERSRWEAAAEEAAVFEAKRGMTDGARCTNDIKLWQRIERRPRKGPWKL